MSTLTSLLDGKASRIGEQMDSFGRETSASLHGAASAIRKGLNAIDHLAESTAKRLDGAGSCVENHTVKRTLAQSRRLVGRYPGKSLVLAAGIGFLTGFAVLRLAHGCDKSAA